MMMSGRAANEVTFTTSYGCFKHIMSNGGVKVLYKGVFANSVRAVGRYYHSALCGNTGRLRTANLACAGGSAMVLVIYDELKHALFGDSGGKSGGH